MLILITIFHLHKQYLWRTAWYKNLTRIYNNFDTGKRWFV